MGLIIPMERIAKKLRNGEFISREAAIAETRKPRSTDGELIKRLREAPNDWYDADLHYEAADAIEELASFKAQITDGHFYCMRDGVLYEAKVELPKGKVFQLPPIEFAEEGER